MQLQCLCSSSVSHLSPPLMSAALGAAASSLPRDLQGTTEPERGAERRGGLVEGRSAGAGSALLCREEAEWPLPRDRESLEVSGGVAPVTHPFCVLFPHNKDDRGKQHSTYRPVLEGRGVYVCMYVEGGGEASKCDNN